MDHELDDLQEEQEETDETESTAESAEVEEVIQTDAPPPVSENTLKHYLNGISRYKPMTKDQEFEIGERIQKGDTEALNTLILSNLKFVVSIANRYRNTGLPISDLINQGNLGLVEAAKRFDHTKGVKFISYAVWWIRQAIIQALAEQSGTVKLPIKQAGILYKINGAIEKLSKQLGREATNSELAEYLGMEEPDIENVLRVSRNYLSLEAPIKDGEDRSFIDLLDSGSKSIEDDIISKTLKQSLGDIIDELTEREAKIIELRFGIEGDAPKTLEEIGDMLKISRERVRQLEARALAKLRKKAMRKKLHDFLN
ncbi:RNA polymerase sigma factor RpoD/SigA [Geovibrio thiophilus]|uniref:RNA polymerase sigma factor RpoD/SigA n=1 Tax=Geovibrio thiophilus TaxID=139438 RepID=A0A3R5V194_9BACT|nr:RNA polymerase sigma factor RpoD/SigA [Geovibrio thiophilus]QAR33181.1 RNA polymerase sigma factor RpoD/SigA [Geovibrio thiophilus]